MKSIIQQTNLLEGYVGDDSDVLCPTLGDQPLGGVTGAEARAGQRLSVTGGRQDNNTNKRMK